METSSIEKSLRITEMMASNHETLEDAFGRHPDWLEIHNVTDKAISLEGVFLSDKRNDPARYAFPAGALIQPREYIVVYASGAKKDIADEYHTRLRPAMEVLMGNISPAPGSPLRSLHDYYEEIGNNGEMNGILCRFMT